MALTCPSHSWDLPWRCCTCYLWILETGERERDTTSAIRSWSCSPRWQDFSLTKIHHSNCAYNYLEEGYRQVEVSLFSQGTSDRTKETGLKSHQGGFGSHIRRKFLQWKGCQALEHDQKHPKKNLAISIKTLTLWKWSAYFVWECSRGPQGAVSRSEASCPLFPAVPCQAQALPAT